MAGRTEYRVGRAFEYRTRDYLAARDYFVMRAAGSRSPVDLLAVKHGRILLIQCKRSGSLSASKWNELYELACRLGAVPLVAFPVARRGIAFKQLVGYRAGRQRPWVEYEPD